MKTQLSLKTIILAGLALAFFNQCALSANDDTTSTGSSSESSDESNVEAAYTSAIESLVQSTNSSNESGAVTSSSSLTTSYLTSARVGGERFRCQDSASTEQSFSCNNSDGTLEHSATFTDCALERDGRNVILNGSLEHTIINGGDGFCEASTSFDFSKMVMGREEGDAVRTRETGPEGLVYSFTNARGFDVTLTATHTHIATYTVPVDENDDGTAESVTATIEREDHFVHEIEDRTAHDVTVFTANAEYSIVDDTEDAETDTDDDSDETEDEAGDDATTSESEDETSDDSTDMDDSDEVVTVTLPVHTLIFDENTGELSGRTIESGNLVVDHNLAGIRIIMGVGEEGLTFDNGDTCGPVSGTLTAVGYELNDDDTLGAIIGTGEVTFEDGEVQIAEFDGEELNLQRLPCH